MSVTIQIIGRLGADAEIRTSKNNKQFVTFRVATDEFKDGKKETVWFNVIDLTERAMKLVEYLKKGSLVSITGRERVSIFTNKNNEPQVSRDIISDRIEFVSTKSSENNKTNETTENVTNTVNNPLPEITCGVLQQASAISNVSVDDDLPF